MQAPRYSTSRRSSRERPFSRRQHGDETFSRRRHGDETFSRRRHGDEMFSRRRHGDETFSRRRHGDEIGDPTLTAVPAAAKRIPEVIPLHVLNRGLPEAHLRGSLIQNSIDDWPSFLLLMSSIVNCSVCLPG